MSNKDLKHVSSKLESSQEHARKAFDSTTAAAREIAETARTAAQSAYREGKNELSAAARDIGHAARATYSSLADQTAVLSSQCCERASELEEELTERVREKPLQSLGIAFGVGLFFGIILSRR